MLIAGLGNNERIYKFTRHNAGFMVIERIIERSSSVSKKRVEDGTLWICRWKDKEFRILKPKGFMNTMGEKISHFINKEGIKVSELVIVHDDMDIPPGKIKVKFGGGSGGHKGLESVILFLNTEDFIRIRVGIGKPPPGIPGADYVLQTPEEDWEKFEGGVKKAADAVFSILENGLEKTMSEFNRRI